MSFQLLKHDCSSEREQKNLKKPIYLLDCIYDLLAGFDIISTDFGHNTRKYDGPLVLILVIDKVHIAEAMFPQVWRSHMRVYSSYKYCSAPIPRLLLKVYPFCSFRRKKIC